MTNIQIFDQIVEDTVNQCVETLVVKAKEYRRNDNPFHNFDIGVQQSTSNESREEVIWGMARKHWISIQDIRNDVKGGKLPPVEILDEKYGDMINYLILEKASIMDKINKLKTND